VPTLRPIDRLKADYLKSQIETTDPSRVKKALQETCNLYRRGYRISHSQFSGFENAVVGKLYTMSDQPKVRRWALNAIAQLGQQSHCQEAVLDVLAREANDPDTVAAGIAAISKLSQDAGTVLKGLGFDEQMIALAALQHVSPERIDRSSLPLDVESASPDRLRLGLILVGVDRAIPHLFNPSHDNAAMVKAVGGHHDPLVSQYSIWAIVENPGLNISDLGVSLNPLINQSARYA
jgi:hypothetical protein